MRLSLLLTCVIVAGMIGVSVFAQTDGEPVPTPADSGSFERDAQPVEVPDDHIHEHGDHDHSHAHETTEQNFAAEDQKLRQQYLELIEQKSVHMDRSALREAISRAESDIDELKADAKLQEAKQLLLDLVKTHPETFAAKTARSMLQAHPVLEPTPDAFGAPLEGATFGQDGGFQPKPGIRQSY